MYEIKIVKKTTNPYCVCKKKDKQNTKMVTGYVLLY